MFENVLYVPRAFIFVMRLQVHLVKTSFKFRISEYQARNCHLRLTSNCGMAFEFKIGY